ncbi:MAG: type I-B CRISPR-associated protein Cas7/Cst2/DevR [Archaeoglobus sp.]|uniref:type I-B CRISPR-associated protein Cas7/Cst2/DevR n=1 Tax=Archaeoglobus sp. TaxID=1872626 RepID=UPI001DF030E9|nr:type I-B CRISPR-associated protein Cas7/Cst2/DevR [Archaeoglobus sp.]MBO8179317.1 type I-B CRISPR-associated protein Cas7/Cst2/DevR [Archaeoglobus sp.]
MRGIEVVWLSQTDLTNLNAGEGEANFIDIKKYKKNGVEYPYVSGQAMRYYFKEAIRRNLDGEYMCVPNDKGETCGNIKDCIGCDLFGFMTTIKKGTVIPGYPQGHPGGAMTRVSPVKVSPAMGLLPFEENAVVDFLTRRHRMEKGEMRGDIVNVEIGVNLYKCGIAIDVARVGGEEKVNEKTRSVEIEYYADTDTRKKRVSKVIEVLRYLSDYSKQARLLTDFTPDVILIAFQDVYSHRLQKALALNNGGLDLERLEAVINDVKEYSPKIIAGILPGVVENENKVRNKLEELGVKVKSTNEAIKEALNYLNKQEL